MCILSSSWQRRLFAIGCRSAASSLASLTSERARSTDATARSGRGAEPTPWQDTHRRRAAALRDSDTGAQTGPRRFGRHGAQDEIRKPHPRRRRVSMRRRRCPAQRWHRAEGAGACPARDQAQVPAHLTIAQDNEDPTALATTLGSRTRPAGRRRPARPAPGGDCAPGRGKALLNQCRAPRQSPRSRSAPQSRSAPSPQRSQSTKDNRLIRCRSPPESVGWEPDRVCRLGGGRPSDCVCTQYYRRQSRSALIPTEARIQRGRRVGVSVPCRVMAEIEQGFKEQANRDLAVWRPFSTLGKRAPVCSWGLSCVVARCAGAGASSGAGPRRRLRRLGCDLLSLLLHLDCAAQSVLPYLMRSGRAQPRHNRHNTSRLRARSLHVAFGHGGDAVPRRCSRFGISRGWFGRG